MIIKILLVFITTIIYDYKVETAPAVTKVQQYLAPLPGYIPVYIRNGDTPLEEINLQLAEAFRAYAEKNARLNSIRARSQNILTDDSKKSSEEIDKLDKLSIDINEENKVHLNGGDENGSQHIQKIKSRT